MSSAYCLLYTPLCLTTSEWKDIAAAVATIIAVPGVIFAAFKTWGELRKSTEQKRVENEQRDRDHQLKRAEFTLAQHRRLFDDPTLLSVLSLVDLDDAKLADATMLNAKRKFITFFEEIALLVNSGYIDVDVAYYMFGYYACRALDGSNFKVGINLIPEHWGLFFTFVENAKRHFSSPESLRASGLRL